MFEETNEEEKRKRKTWFQSLSLISSEEESDDSTCVSSLSLEVENANLRFPYPIFSDDSDEEVKICVLKNKNNSKETRTSRKSKLRCKKVARHGGSSRSGKSNKYLLGVSSSSNSKQTFVRDEDKIVWNYTKKRKKPHVYHRPSTVFSTSEDDSGPDKKKKKKNHVKKLPRLRLTSSEENLKESTLVQKSELYDDFYRGSRSFSKFIDSNSNSEHSDCKENNSNTYSKERLSYSFHDLSSSNKSTDSENSRKPSINNMKGSECKKNSGRKRVNHSISSSEEENKEVLAYNCKAKTKQYSSHKSHVLPSKHPFKNLIASQQLKEDNTNIKRGLKPTSHERENNDTSQSLEDNNKSSNKFDYLQRKVKADPPMRIFGSKTQSFNSSRFNQLKKSFISSNQYSIELSKQIQSHMNKNNKKEKTSVKLGLKNKIKNTDAPYEEESEEGRCKPNSKETRVLSYDREEAKKKEAKYTVNVNVYCNSNQSEPSRSIPGTSEECHPKDTFDKESPHNLDINLSVVQQEKYSKKARISHINQSKNKPLFKPTSCEINTENKLNKNCSLKRIDKHITDHCNANKPGQFDLVGNILSQMKDNPYPYQKGTKKSTEQSSDALGWFPNSNSAALNTHSTSNISNSCPGFNIGSAQYASTSVLKGPNLQSDQPTTTDQSISKSDPSYHPLHKTPHTQVEYQGDTISMGPLNTSCDGNKNNSSVIKTYTNTVSTTCLVPKHSTKEVIIPFYSANHDEYEERLENSQNKQNEQGSSLNREYVTPYSGKGSNLSCLPESSSKINTISRTSESSKKESRISKETIICKKSDRGLPTDIPSHRRFPAELFRSSLGIPKDKNDHKINTGQNILKRDATNADFSSRNSASKMPHGSDLSTKEISTSGTTCTQNLPNELDRGEKKKGVKIRLQGNEYVYIYKASNINKDGENSSLNVLNNTLTNDKLNYLLNTNEQNISEEKNQAKTEKVTPDNPADGKNLTSHSIGNVTNENIQNPSSDNNKNQHSSSNDSDDDTSSSDDSSSSSDSSQSGSSGSSTSENTVIREKKEDLSTKASTLNTTNLEVIILDSSSDDELLTSESTPTTGIDNIEPSDPVANQSKLDHIEQQLDSIKTRTDKSIFDPFETDIECATSNVSIPAVHPILTQTSTSKGNQNKLDHIEQQLESIKSRTDKSIFDPIETDIECATSNVSIPPVHPILTQSSTSKSVESSTTLGLIGKIRIKTAEELNNEILQSENAFKNRREQIEADLLCPILSSQNTHGTVGNSIEKSDDLLTSRAPLKLKLSKVSSENKSLYKVQSTIHIPNKDCQSQTKTVTDKEKCNHSGTLVVKTGEHNFKIVQLQQNPSTEKPITSGVCNASNVPQVKKPIPKLVAIASKPPVILVPVSGFVQVSNAIQPSSTTCTNSDSNSSTIPSDKQNLSDSLVVNVLKLTQEESIKTSSSIQTIENVQSKQPKTHFINPNSQETLEATFFKLCDELFTEVVWLKIPKMVDDLHLTIFYDGFKEERLKRTEQLLSAETILAEKSRAERDFNEQIRIRAQSFVPLFTTVINKINKSNLKTLVIALYIRFIYQLQRIDHKYANYRLSLRHIIKAMLQKSGSTHSDVCQILSDNDTCFKQNYLFIENLITKYDLFVEQRRQKQINSQLVSSETSKKEERNKQQSNENNNQLRLNSTEDIPQPNPTNQQNKPNQKPHESVLKDLLAPKKVTVPSNLAQSCSNNSELTHPVTNLDELMFNSLFKQS